jgi:hypothetical protein
MLQRAAASSKQEFFVVIVQLKLLRFFTPAGLTKCIFLAFSFDSVAHLEFSSKFSYL